MSSKLFMAGQVQVMPSRSTGVEGLSASIDLSACKTYGNQESGSFTINAPSAPLPLDAVAAIRFAAVRSLDGAPMVAVVTSSAGTVQQVPFSDLFAIHLPLPSTPITALAILGVGRIEFIVAGD